MNEIGFTASLQLRPHTAQTGDPLSFTCQHPCENAQNEVLRRVKGSFAEPALIGKPGKGFSHDVVRTPDGYILDPVAEQAIDQGVWDWDSLKGQGLEGAVRKGIFTQQQWLRFAAGPATRKP